MDTDSIISISSGSSIFGEEVTNQCPLGDGDYPNPQGKEWTCSCKSGDKSNSHVLIEVDKVEAEEPQSVICLRYDFDKSETVTRKQQMHADETPLLSYIDESGMSTDAKSNDEHLHQEPRVNGTPKNGITARDIVMINAQLMHTPLSPESQKKELYSYLQLMNPADRKEARRVYTNRRSKRVSNLAKEQSSREHSASPLSSTVVTVNDSKHLPVLPLPPPECYSTIVDFEDALDASGILNRSFRAVHKEKKKMFKSDRFKFNTFRKVKMLRSQGRLRNIDLDKIITNKSNLRQRARRKLLKAKDKLKRSKDQIKKQLIIRVTPLEAIDGRCRATSTTTTTTTSTESPRQDIEQQQKAQSDDENVDLTNFVDDMLELDMLSEEHKKSLIESRSFTTQSKKIVNLISKESLKEGKVKRAYKIFSDITFGNKNLGSVDINLGVTTTGKHELNTISTEASHVPGSNHQHRLVNGSDNITNGPSEQTETSTATIKHYGKTTEHTNDYNKESPSPDDELSKQNTVVKLTISAHKKKISKKGYDPKTRRSRTPEVAAVSNGGSKHEPISINIEHSYANPPGQYESSDSDYSEEEDEEDEDDDEESAPEEGRRSAASLSPVPMAKLAVVPVNKAIPVRTLHRSLTFRKRRAPQNHNIDANSNMWMDETPSEKKRRLNHSISISSEDGSVLGAFYEDHRLVVSQKNVVSFWTQSALGNILGAQDMWLPNGRIQRLVLNNKYVQKHSTEMVMSNDVSVAYVELWTKEHKSDFRERPVSDVFATVYFWRTRQKGLDKKVLQLENIKGFSDDVQYIVTKNAAKIIVSWHYKTENEKKSHIHMYQLAADFQTVANISQIESVDHYISSLHNIEDSDNLLMACGENYITIWNIEYGYKVSTIRLTEIKLALSTLWVKCDRGFLFLVQECVDGELRLIAINGIDQTWKKLQNYTPPESFQSLKGVHMDNGFVLAFYTQGIICWNARTGEDVVEEVPKDIEYMPCGKYVIMIVDEQIVVRHALSHFITSDDF